MGVISNVGSTPIEQNPSAQGYIQLGELLIQWGNLAIPAISGIPIIFPIPFSTVLQTYASSHTFAAGVLNSELIGTDTVTLTGMNVFNNSTNVAGALASWLAIGTK